MTKEDQGSDVVNEIVNKIGVKVSDWINLMLKIPGGTFTLDIIPEITEALKAERLRTLQSDVVKGMSNFLIAIKTKAKADGEDKFERLCGTAIQGYKDAIQSAQAGEKP